MKRLYVKETVVKDLNEMKEKILSVASDFFYKPATNENITYLNILINEIIPDYNFIFSIHDFRTYVHLDFHSNKINMDIRFKELSTNEEVYLEILKEEE
jgi:hypothetical protein